MLEEVIGLYSTFGKEIVSGISSNLAIRPDARNISSMHTGRQVGPDIRYKIPSLAVIAFDFVELNLTQIYALAFNSTNIKGSSNHRGFEIGAR
jgi:hypothetical protein